MEKLDKITQEEWLLCNEFNRNLRDEFIQNSTELSPKSRETYKSSLQIWFNWVRQYCDNKKQVDIKSLDLMKYQNWLLNKGHSSSDISNKRAAVSSLNNYILLYYSEQYPTFHNFVRGVKKPEPSPVHDKIPPNKAEMGKLILEMEKREEFQHLAYLKFTYDTGCRRAETRQLLKDVVNAKLIIKTIKIKNDEGVEEEKESKYYLTHKIRCKGKGKTGKVRTFKFSEDTMNSIKKWLDIRGEDDCEYVFATRYGGRMKQVSETTINQWASRIFTPILGRRFHPHALREARTTIGVVEDGKSLESLQRLLGHNSSETTKIYLCKQDEDDESDELFVD